jgi:hypothetical protein
MKILILMLNFKILSLNQNRPILIKWPLMSQLRQGKESLTAEKPYPIYWLQFMSLQNLFSRTSGLNIRGNDIIIHDIFNGRDIP